MIKDIIYIWIKIVLIILTWETWKWLFHRLMDYVWKDSYKHKRKSKSNKSKCPYLNGEMDE